MTAQIEEQYVANAQGIFTPRVAPAHREEEYDSAGFDILRDMQRRHFWYVGRHRFLLRALRSQLRARDNVGLSAIDAGGGCGGWIEYLARHEPNTFTDLALADSSLRALELAAPVVGDSIKRYQIDLLNLQWENRWDVVFLLDVLEHIPQDQQVFAQIFRALRPGGLLFVTTPALKFFWSHNDEMAHHVRRYSRDDFGRLGREAGFESSLTRYFMFFLSPLLMLSRRKKVDVKSMSHEEVIDFVARSHRVPAAPINAALTGIFSLETPLGLWIPFPWGTSVLGVFRKPR